MARLAKSSTVRSDHSDDDEFPDLDALVSSKKLQDREDAPTKTAIRRRKLGPLTDNLLLKAWTPGPSRKSTEERHSLEEREATKPRRARVELRTRNTKPVAAIASSPAGQDEEYVSAKEEITLIEEVSIIDDTFHSCDSDGSESSEYEDKEDDDFLAEFLPRRLTTKPSLRAKDTKRSGRARGGDAERKDDVQVNEDKEDKSQRATNPGRSVSQTPASKPPARGKETQNPKQAAEELTNTLSGLCLDDGEEQPRTKKTSRPSNRKVTPPSTPPKSRPGLVSPKKLARIPNTPHRSTSDLFWSQEFVDDWNDEHSPRKQLFPDAAAAKQRSPSKTTSPEKKPQKTAAAGQQTSEREAKKAFEKAKHEIAEKFLHELDTTITDGKLAELSASTGGIKLIWTNKLNTTAGRANWKRETIRTTAPSGSTTATTTTTTTKHKHHASIELAEKVIDSTPRLLNVLAHEFCHLANFMISNVITNPHGREFKAWAARCTRAFGDRGIEVTTKHSYDIAFKYVWECMACGAEFKRHSRSIDPARHRCGRCKEELRQTKPVPRKKKEDSGGVGSGVSEYQAFVKAQMRVVKEENPKSPQKEIMKIVAGRWAAQKAKGQVVVPDEEVQEVVEGLEELVL